MSQQPKRFRPPGSRRICQYQGCRNVERFCPEKTFYCHPNPRRRPMIFHQWLVNGGNLAHAEIYTKNYLHKRLCSDHFKVSDFNPISKKLKPHAVPVPVGCSVEDECEEEYPPAETEIEEDSTCEVDPSALVKVECLADTIDTSTSENDTLASINKTSKPIFFGDAQHMEDSSQGRIITCTPPTLKAVGGSATAITLGEKYKLLIYPNGKQVFTSVDSEVASQLDLNSLTSSMKRARKSAFAADIELQDSSGTSNTENAPSTSSTQFTTPAFASVRDPEFGTLEKSGVGQPSSYVPSSTSLPGGTSTQSQGVDGSKGKEKLTSTVTLADLIQTTSTSSTVSYTGGVKVKPIDVLQSKNTSGNAKESISKEVGQPSNINISVRALQSAIQRLETVSNKLVANSRADSYDHFARYISTVLRGLPAKKMHSLKKKIMTEILDALAQEESARLCKNTSKDIQMNLASEITKNYNRKFGTRPSQSTNRPSDPKLLGNEIPIHGNTPHHASVFNPSSSSQEIPDPVACRSSSAIVTTPSLIETTSSIVHPVLSEAATTSVDENFMATNIPKPIMSTSFRNDESLVQSPRRRKRRKTTRARAGKKAPSPCETTTSASDYDSSADEQSISCARKGIQSERDLQSQEDSRGSREEDVSIKIPQPMKNEDQDYEMDIEEGNELAQIKEDQDLFETVLCGESSSLYIKEEAPDPEESVEGDPITPPPAPVNPSTTPLTCQICNTQWDSREDLLTHFSITHQSCPSSEVGSEVGYPVG